MKTLEDFLLKLIQEDKELKNEYGVYSKNERLLFVGTAKNIWDGMGYIFLDLEIIYVDKYGIYINTDNIKDIL